MAKVSVKDPKASDVKDLPFSLKTLYQNPGAYEAKCDTAIIMPNIRIIEKKTGNTVEQLNNMRLVKHTGTMPKEFSVSFFKMIEDEAIPAFVRSYQQAMMQQARKSKE